MVNLNQRVVDRIAALPLERVQDLMDDINTLELYTVIKMREEGKDTEADNFEKLRQERHLKRLKIIEMKSKGLLSLSADSSSRPV